VGAVKIVGSSGPVVLGDEAGCSPSGFAAGATLQSDAGGVTVVGDSFKGSVKVTGDSGGLTLTGNTIARNLTVTGNSGTVVDSPNTVGGKTKVQSRKKLR
ncbi:MAG TPA: hypothetical protein VF706_02240, partial [Solirubrobacteraceae bacterium]